MRPVPLTPAELRQGVERLSRPMPGTIGALYRLRIPETGGLRLSVHGDVEAGRMTVSKSMGGAVAAMEWHGESLRILDLEEGCRLDTETAADTVGLGLMPPRQVIRLLGGRLPENGDGPRISAGGNIVGEGWRATLARQPWRVAHVTGGGGWTLDMSRHTSSLPGFARLEREDGQWLELELVHLEWNPSGDLEPLPDLPPCGPRESRPE